MKKYLSILILALSAIAVNAQVPQLWGAMSIGGSFGIGGIIKINGNGTGYTNIYNCMGGINGGSMQGNFTPYGSALFYGTTVAGGTYSQGDIYRYNTATNTYTSLFSMDSASGFYPRGSLTIANNNLIYGSTSNGGSNNVGVFFSFDPASNQYIKVHEFDTITGQFPNGSVVQSSINNKLYGMTTSGGTNSSGVIFSYDIGANTFAVAHNFSFPTGFAPFGTLSEGPNGLLYGMAFGGGSTGYGVIFSFDPANNILSVIHTFDGANGSAPYGAVLYHLSNILYGCTSQGGTDNKGVIFSFDITNSTYMKLHDFTQATGSSPYGGVIKASDGKLYGMTLNGGLNNLGAIYSYDLSNSVYTKIFDGNFATGGLPYADLIEYTAPTGINNAVLIRAAVEIYPNPSGGSITLKFHDNIKDAKLIIKNLLNQKVVEVKIVESSTKFNLNLRAGIYFYALLNNAGQTSGKLIIE